jgi:DNA invertase Pin-like site-specific DNA recombinase
VNVGYARVSTLRQTNDPQTDRLADCDRVYEDTYSGTKASRPQWDRCLDHLRKGDVLTIVRLDRIGRSVQNLVAVMADLQNRGVDLRVLDQAIDTTTPGGRFVYHIFAALAEMERDLIHERIMDGLASARARGRVGGRRHKLNAKQRATLKRMYDATGPDGRRAHTVAEIAETVGVHRATVYRYL